MSSEFVTPIPLEAEIADNQRRFDEGAIDWRAFSRGALVLAARKMDEEMISSDSVGIHESMLMRYLDSPELQEYEEPGARGEPAREMGTGQGHAVELDTIQSVIETEFGLGLTPETIMNSMLKSGNLYDFAPEKVGAIMRLSLPDNIRALFFVQIMAKTSEQWVHTEYERILDPKMKIVVAEEGIDVYWLRKVANFRTHTAFATQAFERARMKANEIFSGQGDRVLAAFDAIMILKGNTFKRGDRGVHRRKILELLQRGEIGEAEKVLRGLVQSNPRSFDKRAVKRYSAE